MLPNLNLRERNEPMQILERLLIECFNTIRIHQAYCDNLQQT